jgi:sphinganine-1-phosphate aldolase
MSGLVDSVNRALSGYKPVTVVAGTVAAVVALRALWRFMRLVRSRGFKGAVMLVAMKVATSAPGAAGVLERENEKMRKQMEQIVLRENKGGRRTELPEKAMPEDKLFTQLQEWKDAEDAHWKSGRVSGCVYHGGDKLKTIANRAYVMFSLANPLHPDVFPYVRKMEAEVVRMALGLLHGDENACGSMTSGGTESILMAMKAYRDQGRDKGIERPEVVAPVTCHAAFEKAAHYFGIKLVLVPVGADFRADVAAMERAVTRSTVALVGSAPNYPQGVIDPIAELGAVAERHGLGLHVDSCLGGLLLPFLPELGYPVPDFDFKVPQVTSMSADPHKYGFAPKGCSLVLYRSKELRRFQYFTSVDWPGGIYSSPSIAGSRPGGLVAGCWATMIALGREGYRDAARQIMEAARAIAKGVAEIPGLRVLGKPDMSIVAFDCDEKAVGDVYKVGEAMTNRGWNLNTLQNPKAVHIGVTLMTTQSWKDFLVDLRAAVEEVKANPSKFKDGSAAMYGMATTIPDRSLVHGFCKTYLDTLYIV